MKQHEAVIQALEQLGGQATLAQLYHATLKIKDCAWKAKDPEASIRRIVQERQEIFKVRPGLWALRDYQKRLGLIEETPRNQDDAQVIQQSHSYYQGLLLTIGRLRRFETFAPQQDKNSSFINQPLKDVRTLNKIPAFSYPKIVKRCSTVDVVWFNRRGLLHSLFEVEHSTKFQNSLTKFIDLQDFYTRMVIVAADRNQRDFNHKIGFDAFNEIRGRVSFLTYEDLAQQYESEMKKQGYGFIV
jgi:hypothetical protein